MLLPPRPLHALQRQAYVMAELADADGSPIPGYGRDGCVYQDRDSAELPPRWAGRDGTELAGKPVRLRLGLRDATV